MGKIKVTRRDLKRDEVRDFVNDMRGSIRDFHDAHAMFIWMAVSVLAILLVGFWIRGYYKDIDMAKSDAKLTTAMNNYRNALVVPTDAMRLEMLTSSVALCEEIRSEFPGSKDARQSLLVKGNALYYMDHPESAISSFTEYLKTAHNADERIIGHIALGYCHEHEFFRTIGKDSAADERALNEYEAAIEEDPDAYQRRQAMMGKARIYSAQAGQMPSREAAQEYLDKVVSIYEEVIEISEQMEAENKKMFGGEDEDVSPLRAMYPSATDLYDFGKRAQAELDRLLVLMSAGEAVAALERSAPEPLPEEEPATESEDGQTSPTAAVLKAG